MKFRIMKRVRGSGTLYVVEETASAADQNFWWPVAGYDTEVSAWNKLNEILEERKAEMLIDEELIYTVEI